ncbi:hypothetical protein A33M_0776 [Rhodovulum sp. PH10]|nr:hypothetical protein A33M_0776 [Rhodovulum sp. PH10]
MTTSSAPSSPAPSCSVPTPAPSARPRRGFRLALICGLAALLAVPPLAATPADAKSRSVKAKRPSLTIRPARGYGFLPGYEPPDRPSPYRRTRSDTAWIAKPYGPGRRYFDPYTWQWQYGWGGPRYYQGRWNGGSFGPCWTDTPIGPVWNCGK